MENEYWKKYWDENMRNVKDGNVHRQVLRVSNQKPIEESLFNKLLNDVASKLNVNSSDTLLDLCCGNGLITSFLALKCKAVTAVDFCEPLVKEIQKRNSVNNITAIVEDVTKVDFTESSFNKILLYAGLQYLSEKQTTLLFRSLFKWLKQGGTILIGNIPDKEKIWSFYNTPEREAFYFQGILNDTPLIGTWHSQSFLQKLSKLTGFTKCTVIAQPLDFMNAHYRYDILLEK